MNRFFDPFIILVILINTIFIALDKYPQYPDSFLDMLVKLNYFFTAVFASEAILKIIGFGPREYVQDKYNLFDLLVVIISIIELIAQNLTNKSSPSIFSSFRALRLFKIFRLIKVGDLKILLDSI